MSKLGSIITRGVRVAEQRMMMSGAAVLAGGIPDSAREPVSVYTQLRVLARPLTRTSPRGGAEFGETGLFNN
jgi:hypothetical protein